MKYEKTCPKCKEKECIKNGIVNNKQRYLCKHCNHNFTRMTCWKYSDEVRHKAIKLYLEGNGFRRIERLIHVSHMSVINWVKQLASNVQQIPKKNEKVDVLELDEMCISSKKYGFGLL